MKYIIITLSLLFTCTTLQAEENQDILKPINTLFEAMRSHDGESLLQQFTQSALLHRVSLTGSVTATPIVDFAQVVSNSQHHLDEQLLSVRVNKQANLASVWTPFAFYLDGKLSHCGVNSFQMIRQGKQWRIHYLIDAPYNGDCQVFINKHKT